MTTPHGVLMLPTTHLTAGPLNAPVVLVHPDDFPQMVRHEGVVYLESVDVPPGSPKVISYRVIVLESGVDFKAVKEEPFTLYLHSEAKAGDPCR